MRSRQSLGDGLYTVVLKVGGAAVSDKATGEYFGEEVAKRLVRELRRDIRFVIVQGAGYIGHQIAMERRISRLNDNQEAWAYLRYKIVESAMVTLRELVSNQFPAMYLPVNTMVRTRDGKIYKSDYSAIVDYLDRGFMPFMHSDGPIDTEMGLSVLSGDAIVSDISRSIGAKMAVYCSDIDGIEMKDGSIVSRIDNLDPAGIIFRKSGMDVSGGIANKIAEASASGVESYIANLRKDGSLSEILGRIHADE